MILFAVLLTLPAFAAIQSSDFVNCSVRQEMRIDQEGYLRSKVSYADARAVFLPTLTGSATPTAYQVRGTGSNSSINTVSVDQKILDLQSWSLKNAADANVRSSLYAILQRAYENSSSALDDLYAIDLLQNERRLLDIQYQSYKLSMEIMSTGSRLGVADSNDLLQLQGTVLANESELKRLDFQIQQQKANFERRYGYTAVSLVEVLVAPEETKVEVEKIPTLSVLKTQIEQAELEKEALTRGMLPTLSVRGSYSTAMADHPSLRGSYPQSAAAVAIVVDVSNIWKQSEQRSLQQPIINNRTNRLTYTKNLLRNQYDQIENELDTLKLRLPILKKRVAVSQESKKVSQAKLRLGRLSFLELQQAEVAAFNAANDLFSLELRLKQLLVQKELAMGYDTSKPMKISCQL